MVRLGPGLRSRLGLELRLSFFSLLSSSSQLSGREKVRAESLISVDATVTEQY